nr:transglutaminase family protein [Ottowia sp.]
MRLRITHDTRYRYEPPVLTAVHMTHLTPPPTRCQDRLDARLQVHPQPASITESLDIYRNVRTFFEIASPHDELLVRASSLVETYAPDPVGSTLAWDAVRDSFVYHVGAEWHPAAEFIYPSHYVHPGEVFADYA